MNNPPSPLVIPIFITHQGCPHRCVFCNQQPITGTPEQAVALGTEESIKSEINLWLERSPRHGRRVQVAFYGGSFTGLPLERQQRLLAAVQPFMVSGQVDGIRLSTRPDYIKQDTPTFLRDFGVETVELGVQSMDQKVLDQSRRGHSVQHVVTSIAILQAAGISTGVQLMIGLPGETTAHAISGTKRLAQLQPDFARLYPALVIRGSGLEGLYNQDQYRPLSLAQAIILAGRLTIILAHHGIKVIRTGLQPSAELEANLVAGPYHPAFGELVKTRIFFKELRRQLSPYRGRPCRLIIAEQDRSIFSGQKRCNLNRLHQLRLLDHVTVIFSNAPNQRGKIWVEEDIPQPTALT